MTNGPTDDRPTDRSIKRTRVVHCRKEPFDIYIGRSQSLGQSFGMSRYPELRATGWGNPFRPAPAGATGDPDAGSAIARYRAWLMERPQLLARLSELRGKTLGCWCAPLGGLYGDLEGRICHGQVLAALADASGHDTGGQRRWRVRGVGERCGLC